MSRQIEYDRAVLSFNPWGDDDSDYRVLRNEFVVVRFSHHCDLCFGPISQGQRVRVQTERYDGKVASFRFCPTCCAAMAAREWDDGESIEARYSAGQQQVKIEREAEK